MPVPLLTMNDTIGTPIHVDGAGGASTRGH